MMDGESRNHCLIPFNPREAISVSVAARRAGRSERTIRLWCEQHGIGRRVGGGPSQPGPWMVSKVALALYLDGEHAALQSYLEGDRSPPLIGTYCRREGVRST